MAIPAGRIAERSDGERAGLGLFLVSGKWGNQMRTWRLAIVASIAAMVPGTGVLWADLTPAQAADSAVQVNDEVYTPAEITVAPGSTVTWQNTGSAPHSAKSQDGSFDSGYIMPGAQGQFTFSTAGDFPYFCEPHPYKEGVVHVK